MSPKHMAILTGIVLVLVGFAFPITLPFPIWYSYLVLIMLFLIGWKLGEHLKGKDDDQDL